MSHYQCHTTFLSLMLKHTIPQRPYIKAQATSEQHPLLVPAKQIQLIICHFSTARDETQMKKHTPRT